MRCDPWRPPPTCGIYLFMKPKVGDPMPHFTLPSSEGGELDSRTLLGHGPIVLYFYPKDQTPGCTAEACSFRDDHEAFIAAGARVLGVSPDPIDSHLRFKERHGLPFTLLSDVAMKVFALYGVESLLGFIRGRETFVMDAGGIIRHHVDSRMFPGKHVRESLATVQRLGA